MTAAGAVTGKEESLKTFEQVGFFVLYYSCEGTCGDGMLG